MTRQSIRGLSDVRLLVAELLFGVVEAERRFAGESSNFIHDSTFHILFMWCLEKSHNSLYLNKYLNFFTTFCSKANNVALINGFLKTNIIADLSNFIQKKIIEDKDSAHLKEDFWYVIKTIIKCIKGISSRLDCDLFHLELYKSANWKYVMHVNEDAAGFSFNEDSLFRDPMVSGMASTMNSFKLKNWAQGGAAKTPTNSKAVGKLPSQDLKLTFKLSRIESQGPENFSISPIPSPSKNESQASLQKLLPAKDDPMRKTQESLTKEKQVVDKFQIKAQPTGIPQSRGVNAQTKSTQPPLLLDRFRSQKGSPLPTSHLRTTNSKDKSTILPSLSSSQLAKPSAALQSELLKSEINKKISKMLDRNPNNDQPKKNGKALKALSKLTK